MAKTPNQDDLTIEFIRNMNIDVNKVIEAQWDQRAEGPLLISALRWSSLKLLKALIIEFGADINKEIKVNGKESTLLIFAIRCAAG